MAEKNALQLAIEELLGIEPQTRNFAGDANQQSFDARNRERVNDLGRGDLQSPEAQAAFDYFYNQYQQDPTEGGRVNPRTFNEVLYNAIRNRETPFVEGEGSGTREDHQRAAENAEILHYVDVGRKPGQDSWSQLAAKSRDRQGLSRNLAEPQQPRQKNFS